MAGKILPPDSGTVKFIPDDENHYALSVAAVSPELKIYDALTAEKISELGERVGLDLKTFAAVRTENFSTGMRQRLKFAILLGVDADIWLLDEPTANLDDDGREKFFVEIQAAAPEKIILLATNDKLEEKICDEIIHLPL